MVFAATGEADDAMKRAHAATAIKSAGTFLKLIMRITPVTFIFNPLSGILIKDP